MKSEPRPMEIAPGDAEILKAVREVRFGSVEVTIHDGHVVQVERREKVRFAPAPPAGGRSVKG